mmetsp:Transcript_26590/g.90741  ORF Transcript_26590/g.90741 Transcript_26590/m.90741 type:complete len:211 (+) Transcript_26590:510-1142(+)
MPASSRSTTGGASAPRLAASAARPASNSRATSARVAMNGRPPTRTTPRSAASGRWAAARPALQRAASSAGVAAKSSTQRPRISFRSSVRIASSAAASPRATATKASPLGLPSATRGARKTECSSTPWAPKRAAISARATSNGAPRSRTTATATPASDATAPARPRRASVACSWDACCAAYISPAGGGCSVGWTRFVSRGRDRRRSEAARE